MNATTPMAAHQVWTAERQLFKAVTEPTALIAWATDIEGACFYLSPEWYRFTGRACEAGEGHKWLDAIHHDDREMVRFAFFSAHRTRTAYGVAYRLVRTDSSFTLTWAVGLPKFDDNNAFQGFFGTVFPIEHQHQMQLGQYNSGGSGRRLTDRERDILKLVAEGGTSDQVATTLGITRRTVEAHIANASLKLGGSNRTHTVARAIKLNEI